MNNLVKKIYKSVVLLVFLSSASFADTTNIGLTISGGDISASGSHTTNSAGSGGGGAAVNSTGNAQFPFGSIFVERELALSAMNLSIGIDYIPIKSEVDTITGGTGTDAKISLKNHYTLYLQPGKKLDNGITVFAKVGYSHGDLVISDVRRQTSTANTASTDSGSTKNLEGYTYGIGFEKTFDSGLSARLSLTRSEYDEISHTTSNGKVLKASADVNAINLSVVKKF